MACDGTRASRRAWLALRRRLPFSANGIHDYPGAIIMVVLGKLIPSLFDRLVRARLSRRLGDNDPMITLLGVLAGVRLIAPVGVFVGPALLRIGFSRIDLYEREYGLVWTRSASS